MPPRQDNGFNFVQPQPAIPFPQSQVAASLPQPPAQPQPVVPVPIQAAVPSVQPVEAATPTPPLTSQPATPLAPAAMSNYDLAQQTAGPVTGADETTERLIYKKRRKFRLIAGVVSSIVVLAGLAGGLYAWTQLNGSEYQYMNAKNERVAMSFFDDAKTVDGSTLYFVNNGFASLLGTRRFSVSPEIRHTKAGLAFSVETLNDDERIINQNLKNEYCQVKAYDVWVDSLQTSATVCGIKTNSKPLVYTYWMSAKGVSYMGIFAVQPTVSNLHTMTDSDRSDIINSYDLQNYESDIKATIRSLKFL